MKILFVTQLEEIHSSIILNELIKSKHEITGVITSKTLIHKKSLLRGILDVVRRSGFRYFAMRAMEGVYIKFYKYFKMVGIDRFKEYSPCSVKEIIKKYILRHFPVYNINSAKSLHLIRKLNPDIAICCVFNQVFKKELLWPPKYGCINIHRSYLPDYRGVSPTLWVLANNEKKTGITIHQMTEKIDSGEILAQKELDIKHNDTVNTLSFRLMKEASLLIKDILEKIGQNKKIKIKKNAGGRYYSWPTKDTVKRFIKYKKKIL